MKKRARIILLIALIVYAIAFAYIYFFNNETVTVSLVEALYVTGAVLVAIIIMPSDLVDADYKATKYNTDLGTGALISKLEEHNKQLEKENKQLKENRKNDL